MRSTLATICLLFIGSIYAIVMPTADDMATMKSRRIEHIVKYNSANSTYYLNRWKNTLNENRTWADIDMTSGCGSRIANWPAQQHLIRVLNLAIGYHETMQPEYLKTSLASLDYWLENDFDEHDCIENGGVASMNCPCGTPGLWSKNWFNQLIGIPSAIGDTCLLLRNELNESQKKRCITIQARAFAKVTSMTQAISVLTGANLLDVADIGITLAMFKDDLEMLKTALEAFYDGVTISETTAGDGIQADGSFIQHKGILYNGNYGKDFASDVLAVFTETVGLDIGPSESALTAFKTLMDGSEWMMIADTKLQQLLWQYSAIGRMVSFKYSDQQSSGGVVLDLKEIAKSAQGSATEKEMQAISDRLNGSPTGNANQGNLIGTRYFYNSDYMVSKM
ncbi:chondroitin AC/alginate lyase [Choanephora cucurbitarum]|nr:chondroitin AC/alginate lyase [Choanephora cucurbitarum]